MVVELAFRPDEHAARRAPLAESAAVIEETELVVPVRFRVDGRDMLASPGPVETWSVDPTGVARPGKAQPDEWGLQPLIGFLVALDAAIAVALEAGTARWSLALGHGDIMLIRRADGLLDIASRTTRAAASASVADLRAALDRCRDDARLWLRASAPHLLAHEAWSTWFPGD